MLIMLNIYELKFQCTKARLVNDLDTIQSVISSRNIIIGEFGHGSLGSFGSYPSEVVGRTNDVLDTALDWGCHTFSTGSFSTRAFGVFTIWTA